MRQSATIEPLQVFQQALAIPVGDVKIRVVVEERFGASVQSQVPGLAAEMFSQVAQFSFPFLPACGDSANRAIPDAKAIENRGYIRGSSLGAQHRV